MRLSELRHKEIIDIQEGRRIGRIGDCEVSFDTVTGRICELLVPEGGEGFRLFGKTEERLIAWNQIHKISDDFILVGQPTENSLGKWEEK